MKNCTRLLIVTAAIGMFLFGAGCARTSHKTIMSNMDGVTGATLKP